MKKKAFYGLCLSRYNYIPSKRGNNVDNTAFYLYSKTKTGENMQLTSSDYQKVYNSTGKQSRKDSGINFRLRNFMGEDKSQPTGGLIKLGLSKGHFQI